MKKILDKNINYSNFAIFKRSQVVKNGLAAKFVFMNDYTYIVPLAFLLKLECELDKPIKSKPKKLKIIRTRKLSDGCCIGIYLNNGSMFCVVWDTLLMLCEPMYEHFGGFTKESKILTKNNLKKLKQFKV